MHPLSKEEAIASQSRRFFEKVQKVDGGCWLWMASRLPKGYGTMRSAGGKVVKAHRVSYEIHKGPIPPGMVVCHKCDNPPCVNPEHLFVGTPGDNNRDRDAKGRLTVLRGERHSMATITEDVVRKIRAAVAGGLRQITVARHFGVSACVVNDIIKGRTWTHVV